MAKPIELLDQFGRPFQRESPQRRAGYDAAKTNRQDRGHWSDADALAPVSQLTPAVRRTLRNRARYECQNNSYAAGLVRTLVVDTVGSGPRLQMLTDDDKLNEAIEDQWRLWTSATNMALNFRIMAGVRYVAGECFGVFRDSKKLDKEGYPVTLDLRLIEPDQVTDGYTGQLFNPTGDDGIVVDDEGEVTAYKILRHHPGDNRAFIYGQSLKPDVIDARNVVQWYQPERPGQLRGATPLAPSLNIFGQLRRFTGATLAAAEVASYLSGVFELPDVAMDGTPQTPEFATMDTVELVKGMLLTVPGGGKVSQFKPEQPTTNYQMFVNAKLRECGRCLNVPFGKMAGDHSMYNYSSGRMDDAPYWHDREIERGELEAKAFDRIFWKFCEFAALAIPQLAAYRGKWWSLKHSWHYDAKPSSDPVKDATGDELNLTNGSDTLAGIAARDGTTTDALLRQRRRDLDLFEKYDLPLPPWATGGVAPVRNPAEGQPQTQGAPANAA